MQKNYRKLFTSPYSIISHTYKIRKDISLANSLAQIPICRPKIVIFNYEGKLLFIKQTVLIDDLQTRLCPYHHLLVTSTVSS